MTSNFALGIDIGGSGIKGAVVDLAAGDFATERLRIDTPQESTPANVAAVVGEIVDEYDHEVPPVTELGEGRFRVSARLPIDDLGELFGLKVDDEDVDTVLGLMAKELNKVPIPGSVVQWEGIELTAERSTDRRAEAAVR